MFFAKHFLLAFIVKNDEEIYFEFNVSLQKHNSYSLLVLKSLKFFNLRTKLESNFYWWNTFIHLLFIV